MIKLVIPAQAGILSLLSCMRQFKIPAFAGMTILLVGLLLPLPAAAKPLVADLSAYRIDMDANFTGARLFLFGVREEPGDIVAVIRGPEKNYILRKKENIAGLWVNRNRIKFFNVPAFYALASSKPLAEIESSAFKQKGIGEQNLLSAPSNPIASITFPDYVDAFLNHQYEEKRYTKEHGTIQFVGNALFKSVIEFPSNIPPGEYKAEFYLIHGGKVIGSETLPISVVKTGVEAWVYSAAHQYPMLYGLAAVLIALGAGWAASRLFEKI